MKAIRFLCLGAICVPMALASPTCVSGTLADYVALSASGCGLDGITFSNFQYVTAAENVAAPPAASITVAPSAGFAEVFLFRDGLPVGEQVYAAGFNFDIEFSMGRIEGRSRSLDMDILYEAASPAGINTAVVFVTLGGDYLSTARSLTSIAGQACTYADGGGAYSTACEFAATTSLSIDHNIHIAVGEAFPGVGGAGVSALNSGFVTTPEPAAWLVSCPALLLLAGIARMRWRNAGRKYGGPHTV